jgi:hypothetical protein
MWAVIKTIFFGLLDLFVLLVLIKWLFQTPRKFFEALWQAGRGSFLSTVIRDKNNDPIAGYKIFLTIMIVAGLIWAEKSLFY